MPNSFPTCEVMRLAIEIYMKHAYDGPPPVAVRDRLKSVNQQPADTLFDCKALERDLRKPPMRFSLRLGNRRYPHMKLTVESTPDETEFFFKADTHDRHCCPPSASVEYQSYLAMTEANEALSKQIEADWAAAGIPTFREYLRNDLARRMAMAAK